MRTVPLLALLLLVPACQDRAASPAAPASRQAAAPAPAQVPTTDEVTRLAQRIEACEHFAGEEPYDAERAAELRKQIAANCPGNAEALARLRAMHAGNPAMTRRLDELGQHDN